MKAKSRSTHPEVRIYQAQQREDARAEREGRLPRLIKTVTDITEEGVRKVAPHRKRIHVTIEMNVPEDWTIGITASEVERVLRDGLPIHSEPEVGEQRMARGGP